jgi:hypothetical protein
MHKYKDIVEGTHFDVALCDHFTIPCVDIAQNVDIPLIITTALAISQGTVTVDSLICHKTHGPP